MLEEYEVEAILRAKVVKRPRGKKTWSYWVKWKNYEIADNTWEPTESFGNGSEHFIKSFWERIDLKGRDPYDLTQFNEDEEVFPSGPPRKAKKSPQKKPRRSSPSPPPEKTGDSEVELISDEEPRGRKRRSSNVAHVEPPTAKRPRGRKSKAQEEEVQEESPERMVTRRQSMGNVSAPSSNARPKARATSSSRKPTSRREEPAPKSPVRRARNTVAVSPVRSSRKPAAVSPVRSAKRSRKAVNHGQESSADEMLLVPDQQTEGQASTVHEPSAELGELEYPLHDEQAPAGPTDDVEMAQADEPFGEPSLLVSAIETPPRQRRLPAHHARKANPRVKLLEESTLSSGLDNAISAKARLAGEGASRARRGRVSGSKAGPGKSSAGMSSGSTSVLVAQKGTLTTVKGKSPVKAKYTPVRVNGTAFFESGHLPPLTGEQVDITESNHSASGSEAIAGPSGDPDDTAVPTSEQQRPLVEAAGLSRAVADALSDYEEDAPGEDDVGSEAVPALQLADLTPDSAADAIVIREKAREELPELPEQAPQLASEVVVVDKMAPKFPHTTSLFSNGGSAAPKDTSSTPITAGWRMSTIFGPLGFGQGAPAPKPDVPAQSNSAPARPVVTLNLDAAVKLSLTLKDIHPPGAFDELQGKTTELPGKFYKEQHALSLLDSLSLKDAVARLSLDSDVSEDLKKHFERFSSRLFAGDLFVEQVGFELLAMCAADNLDLTRRLNVPDVLIGLGETVVVSRVRIEDYNAYTDSVMNAEQNYW
ncbi:hypothetical protein OBBRIDRAFT_751660 [Obba rivulosa]|uniref:Chromo domain-containing protein n=1 Tax=Obba rivulosa TaxID=1052685 RepID=A0A8E2DMI8_9APHY|nr:hypothetical protein OBBRIDRAFT_751660 [Obba rivulosa]